jgi:hypothetical protein
MKFISINANLYDEMKLLLDLEQTSKDITAQQDGPTLLDFQNKVELKRQEVKNLKELGLSVEHYLRLRSHRFGKISLHNFQ